VPGHALLQAGVAELVDGTDLAQDPETVGIGEDSASCSVRERPRAEPRRHAQTDSTPKRVTIVDRTELPVE
jgi:hypothetical protein